MTFPPQNCRMNKEDSFKEGNIILTYKSSDLFVLLNDSLSSTLNAITLSLFKLLNLIAFFVLQFFLLSFLFLQLDLLIFLHFCCNFLLLFDHILNNAWLTEYMSLTACMRILSFKKAQTAAIKFFARIKSNSSFLRPIILNHLTLSISEHTCRCVVLWVSRHSSTFFFCFFSKQWRRRLSRSKQITLIN